MKILPISRFALLFLLCLVCAGSPIEESSELQAEIESELKYLERARNENPDLMLLNEANLKMLTGESDIRKVLRNYWVYSFLEEMNGYTP